MQQPDKKKKGKEEKPPVELPKRKDVPDKKNDIPEPPEFNPVIGDDPEELKKISPRM